MPQLSSRSLKEVFEKSRFHGKNTHGKIKEVEESSKPSYAQILSKNIRNILKIKEIFPELSNKKIKELNKTIFSKTDKLRPRINMTTKGLSHKQIIIPIGSDNTSKFMSLLSEHIANFNQSLKNTKSDLIVDFIHTDHWGLIITFNRVTSPLEITIVKYIRNCNHIDSKNIQDACFPQSKSYLKILGIPYIMEGTNIPINSDIMKSVIKNIHIFDNINITSNSHVVKVSPKSDMAII